MDPRIEQLATAAREGVCEVERVARELGERTVEARSETGAVAAVVSLHGRLTGLTLRSDALHEYDSASLGEVIAATIQAGQRRGREKYDAAVREATPPAVAEYLDQLRRVCRG
jgi:hypothetical protein